MPVFAAATLIPAMLIAAGAAWGGVWIASAVAFMTLFIGLTDELARRADNGPGGSEFPAGTALSVILGGVHFVLLTVVIWRIAGDDTLGTMEKAGLFIAAGLYFGQISNPNAHELIHCRPRWLRNLGSWIYISLLYGHHSSAHTLVHHIRVATPADPATARRGESLYRYMLRAWVGGFREGLQAEIRRSHAAGRPAWRNPYIVYVGGALGLLALSYLVAGPKGVLFHLWLAAFAQTQLLMSDYVQHYGLMRRITANGRPVPVGAEHSWNSPHRASAAMMLNAPRHSDHHVRPMVQYPALRLDGDMPMLPRSLPAMCCIALSPNLWRRVMDPRVAEWRAAHDDVTPAA
ncbi:alkane 1-monooxygenase [Ponticoccus sp. SC2-23]|uniref:alkane 1-monooxygenase n=1 Tax=Alexandriicola marinus TaxID=2081710 RepID=UPI000FD898A6|nr:alkane 1-monooxygenase [Alexandriicola marinus]MBM1221060.1 alkane 1-monooxygenase [Ponticoccus sp. SC6-9]MBM1225630.1 alkane 1-monooxygenase [Ponticoccus sp. SC6-15]MBM1227782.1 alkane 1-monooxygenase [Ponticoccus sp. SC6-38]MBM1234580.1 alkane 1-monooxygenase [Ponticoccus sp. SC6-45]MBM1238284.1 alkane 1-monooxygenase [Ponticoccus sp. SC6-49]MBM1243553.1 alkane 1-monooxygenase [Ponticoccus sp. SC2-64]MBM1248104.1 alkane 1-monooxygenase [Ponticoccus sp. SC6-42]MBM1252684.1 alkane 1-mono